MVELTRNFILFYFSQNIFYLKIKNMFVSRKLVFGKSLSKLSCICLPLEKFINGNTFWSTKSTFQLKKNLVWFPGKCFFFWLCLCFRKVFSGKPLSKLSCVCLPLEKLVNGKIWLGFQESVSLKNLGGKHFPEIVKNLEMSLFADYIKFDPQTFD